MFFMAAQFHQMKLFLTSCASFYTHLSKMTYLVHLETLMSPLQFKIKFCGLIMFGCTAGVFTDRQMTNPKLTKPYLCYIICKRKLHHVQMSVVPSVLVDIMPRNVRGELGQLWQVCPCGWRELLSGDGRLGR